MNDLLFDMQKEYQTLSLQEKELLHELFKRDASSLSYEINFAKSLIYKGIPPTPQEFLDHRNGWLPKQFAESIFDWVREDFCEFLSPKKNYDHMVQYGATRTGKSTLAVLLMMYCIVYIHHLRDVGMYYNLAGGTQSLSLYILSFQYKKVYELYLKPLYDLLQQSDRFIKIKMQDDVAPEQNKRGMDYIVYSKAALVGHITLASGLRLVSGNDDALSIIGANILAAFISEISFFVESAGTTETSIFRLYSDVIGRIQGTVGKNYLGFAFLDTSANNRESEIENFILKELSTRPECMFRWKKRWDVNELVRKFYKIYNVTQSTFPVCIGDGTIPAKILHDDEVQHYASDIVVHVPVDLRLEFETNLIKSIKDVAGIPTTSESKFIQNRKLILDIFDENLENEEGIFKADSKDNPEGLLWNQFKDKFFTKYDGTNYTIKRASKEVRYIGLDLAHAVKGDVIGICMIHREMKQTTQEIVNVVDFNFAIGPGENGINIEAVSLFIRDLNVLGGVVIQKVNVDRFQSENLAQFLNRNNIPCIKTSVDMDIQPYMYLYSCLLAGNVKVGRNIFLKNNLESLYRVKSKMTGREKIDHSNGDTENNYFGDWGRAKAGCNAKDVSDALVQCLNSMKEDDILPVTLYEQQNNKKSNKAKENVSFQDEAFRSRIRESMKALHGKLY